MRSRATSGAKRLKALRAPTIWRRTADDNRLLRHSRSRTTISSSMSGWPSRSGAKACSTTQPIRARGRARRSAVSTGRQWTMSPMALVRMIRMFRIGPRGDAAPEGLRHVAWGASPRYEMLAPQATRRRPFGARARLRKESPPAARRSAPAAHGPRQAPASAQDRGVSPPTASSSASSSRW